MLNQGQGTYPQLAGSFYNSAQMMPHDNGRNARQIPTFFGGLQNTMSAASAMHNYQGMPLSQNILNTQALAHHQYGQGLANTIGGLGTGIGVAGLVGGLGTFAAGKLGAAPSGLLMRGLGLAGGLPLAVAGMGVMATMSVYKQRMAAIEDMRNAMQGSRLGYGLSDPITGGLSNTGALELSRRMEFSAAGSGFKDKELKQIMGQASGLGMLNGMQSLGEVTKRVTDLAKASREIVMLGEGISMSDAMQLQKLTQDMGISTTKFRGMNIGKNLVMAARAAGMSADQAAQVGGQGAMTFQQLGLGAASGMNAAFYSTIAAKGLAGVGAFSQRQLAALGGEQGLAQNLMAGQAGTMARMSDSLIMGAVKLGGDGEFRIDRELLDRYIRGDVSAKELRQRGRDLGKGMSKGQRARLLEGLSFAMPGLKEQVTDMLTSEEMMSMQGREILELRKRTGLSMRRAAQAYFGDAAQAETFLGYAQNHRAVRAEAERQRRIADTEQMLKYAGMAKSSSAGAQIGRGIVSAAEATGDFFMAIPTVLGEGLASTVQRMQDSRNRGLRSIMGIGDNYGGVDIDTGAIIRGGRGGGARNFLTYDRGVPTRRKSLIAGTFSSYSSMARHLLTGENPNVEAFLENVGLRSGLNEVGGGGLGQQLTEFREGEYNLFRQMRDLTGIEGSTDQQAKDLIDASKIADEAIELGRLVGGNNRFRYSKASHKAAFRKAMDHIRNVSVQAARGEGTGSGGPSGVDSSAIMVSTMRNVLSGFDKETQDAAMAEAFRRAKSVGGEVSTGFNLMLSKNAGIAGLMQLGQDSVQERIDSVRLASSTADNPAFIEAKGLSSALAESGLSQADMQELVKTVAETGTKLIQEGAGNVSAEAVLKEAGISRHKYRRTMGGVKKVIDSLLRGQVTTGEGKKRKTISLVGSLGTNIKLDLADKAVQSSIDADTLKKLRALDSEIGKRIGDGGEYLRQDLASAITISGEATEGEIKAAREFYAREQGTFDEESKKSAFLRAQMIEAGRLRGELRDTAYISEGLEAFKPSRFKIFTQEYADYQKKRDANRSRAIALDAQLRGVMNPTGDYKARLEERAEQLMREAYAKNVSDEEALDYYKKNARSLLSRSGTLSEALEDLAERQTAGISDEKERAKQLKERKDAYSKLMTGQFGAELETEFRAARSGLRGITDPQKRQDAEIKLMQKIIEKARAQGVEGVPGAEKSKSLPQVLGEISEGITEFKKAMQAVAKITTNGNELTIKLPQAK